MLRISNEVSIAEVSHQIFFTSLDELDNWASAPRKQAKLGELIDFVPRSKTDQSSSEAHGKLLVCHDYKGGYSETLSSLGYTFNFWDRCDIFIYFSHHRVTIPPPGWINAAHRQGVKILGVLIFEHKESMEDTLRLLLGNIPKSRTGPPATLTYNGLPISRHYARLLADLAYERGFEGYLLNFEFPFPGKSEQARALEAWVSILNGELKRRVGEHSETIWYDSVITTGDLRWQDRLNSRNFSFFLPSDGFFTNYTWPAIFPHSSAQYLLSIEQEVFQGKRKSLGDIYVGIDVWGRGSHGGGGLGAFRATEHIDPRGLGLSVALFGPAWTWEYDEGSEGPTWDVWWERERTLWIGPAIEGARVEVPEPPLREGELPCPHGEFKPLADFFATKPPPNPELLPLCTIFCPGVGYAWFVEGKKVVHKDNGWTDVDKQTSLGNLLWPRPKIAWEGSEMNEALPKASTKLVFEDAFNGGSSVSVMLNGEGNSEKEQGAAFRCLWIPIQSVALTPGGLYTVELVYKVPSASDDVALDFDLALSVKGETSETDVQIKALSLTVLENGWTKFSITCKSNPSPGAHSDLDVLGNIGIILAIASEDASLPYNFTIQLGQLSVFLRSSLPHVEPFITRVLWADCTPLSPSLVDVKPDSVPSTNLDSNSDSTHNRDSNSFLFSWDTTVVYASPATVGREDLAPEVAHPPWTLDRSPSWYPRVLYANVYARTQHEPQSQLTLSAVTPSGDAVFLGTSGWGSGALSGVGPNAFLIEKGVLLEKIKKKEGADRRVRFFVQPVTDRGEVLPWERCAFVDFNL